MDKNTLILNFEIESIISLQQLQNFIQKNIMDKNGIISPMTLKKITNQFPLLKEKILSFFSKPINYKITLTRICNLLLRNITTIPICPICNKNFLKLRNEFYLTNMILITSIPKFFLKISHFYWPNAHRTSIKIVRGCKL